MLATENVIGGYTSASSNTFLLTVIYGPDRVELNVPETYFVTEGQPIENITCTADCYPGCSYRWMNNSVPVGSGGVIQLGTARRYHAGNYTCSARNTAPEFGKSSEQSTTIIVTCDEVKTSGNSSALIVDVVLGVLGSVLIGLGICVAILIVKLRKLLYLKGRDVSGKSATPREMPCHANVTYNKDSTENEDWPTSSGLLLTEVQADNQYTSLEARSRNDASTYDVMIADH